MTLSKEAFLAGQVLLIDKPLQWTSFQVVNKIRWLIRKNLGIKKIKVGHAGTLDPLATGLLIVCCGKMTKNIEKFQGEEKEYSGAFLLGSTTPSFDLETQIDRSYPIDHITPKLLDSTRALFTGTILQRPPLYSALKKEGKRLYDYARKGEVVDIPPREINITDFSIETTNFPTIEFNVSCSKGTYIRSLVHDFGQALQSGAHLTELRRTRIGDFQLENALTIDAFEQLFEGPKEDKE